MLDQIKNAAQCLLGISEDWKYSDVRDHLDWLLDNKSEIADGYPLEVMDYEYRNEILKHVKVMLAN